MPGEEVGIRIESRMLKLVALKRSSSLVVFKNQCFCRIVLEAVSGVPIVHPSKTIRNTCRARKARWIRCATVRVSSAVSRNVRAGHL